jgi:tetratricopeptide (TPR) repeat protein
MYMYDPEPSVEHYHRGREHMAIGEFAEAVEEFRQSWFLDRHFKTIELWGECLYRLERHEEAVVLLAAATTLNKQPRAPTLLAEAFLALGDQRFAYEAAKIALERHPQTRRAQEILRIIGDCPP